MQSLWRWRVVNKLDFERVRLSQFVSGKLGHRRIGAKQSIGADGIKLVIKAEIVILFSYGLLK